MNRRAVIALWIGFAFIFAWVNPVKAQSSTPFGQPQVDYLFGSSIWISIPFQSDAALQSAQLRLELPGAAPLAVQALFDSGQLLASFSPAQYPLRPFSPIHFRFTAKLSDGTEVSSQDFPFEYADNRFIWQQTGSPPFALFWVDGDTEFGQQALTAAMQGLQSARRYLDVIPEETVRIYIYPSPTDLQTAIGSNTAWASGHAVPELGILLVSIPAGAEQRLEMERQIPHEIMHQLQYQVIGEQYRSQPAWLMEGMASISELYPNAEYERALNRAVSAGRLIPFETLCAGFPSDAGSAYLAYAQSASFVKFIHRNFGASGLRDLISRYQDGLGCAEGVQSAFGVSLAQLEFRWRQEDLNTSPEAVVIRNLLPFLAIGALLIGMTSLGILVAARKPGARRKVA